MFELSKTRFMGKTCLALVLGCLAGAGITNATAGGDQEFRWFMGQSDPDVTGINLCQMATGTPTCPDRANEAGGGYIEMAGVGTLKVEDDGDPEDIKGGGTFSRYDGSGNLMSSGKWKAKKLLMFDSYGGSTAGPPANFRAGRMIAEIRLKSDGGGGKTRAVVELGCRIPGNPGIPGTIEGIRVYLDNGPGFVMAVDPRPTLFVELN